MGVNVVGAAVLQRLSELQCLEYIDPFAIGRVGKTLQSHVRQLWFDKFPEIVGSNTSRMQIGDRCLDTRNRRLKMCVRRWPQCKDRDPGTRPLMSENFVDDKRFGESWIPLQHIGNVQLSPMDI